MSTGSLTNKLSHVSFELLDHLRAHGPATAEALHAVLSPGRPHMRLRDTALRLKRLEALSWLYSEVGHDGAVHWHALAIAPPVGRPAPRPKPYVGQVAAPRRIDVMHSTWVPPAGSALRSGALDYQRCASRGVRC